MSTIPPSLHWCRYEGWVRYAVTDPRNLISQWILLTDFVEQWKNKNFVGRYSSRRPNTEMSATSSSVILVTVTCHPHKIKSLTYKKRLVNVALFVTAEQLFITVYSTYASGNFSLCISKTIHSMPFKLLLYVKYLKLFTYVIIMCQ